MLQNWTWHCESFKHKIFQFSQKDDEVIILNLQGQITSNSILENLILGGSWKWMGILQTTCSYVHDIPFDLIC